MAVNDSGWMTHCNIPSFSPKPKRTLEFHGYSAEEQGLRGSQAIVSDYCTYPNYWRNSLKNSQ